MVLFTLACEKEQVATLSYPTLEAKVYNKTILAGESLKIEIKQTHNPTSCDLILSNGIITIEEIIPAKAKQVFDLKSIQTEAAGTFTLRIVKHDSLLFEDNIKILPIALTDPIDIFSGPRTINVDQKQQSMVVAIPRDSFGNPIADGLGVKFAINEEGEQISTSINEVENLIAYQIIEANINSRNKFIGVSHPNASSTKQKTISIPSWPLQIELESEDLFPYANNRNFVKIKTNQLKDQYGNTIPDGTLIRFHIIENGLESGRYNGITIDGIAFTYLKNPSKKSEWLVKASVGDRFTGKSLRINFQADLIKLYYKIEQDIMTVGPLRGQLGQYISDGSKVRLEIDGEVHQAETLKGIATFELENIKWDERKAATLSAGGLNIKLDRNE